VPEGSGKHPLVLLLSSQKDNRSALLPGCTLADTKDSFLRFLLYFCYNLTCNDVVRLPRELHTSFGSIISPSEVAISGLDLLLYLG